MHNPLSLLRPDLLKAMIEEGKVLFVRQTYLRGTDHLDQTLKGSFLFSHYSDPGLAAGHMSALTNDSFAKLYDASIPADLEKLYAAANQPAGYRIYAAVLRDREWRPPPQLANQIKNYVSSKTNWKPRGKQSMSASLSMQNGELFLVLKSGEGQLKVPLKDIETGGRSTASVPVETKTISVYFHRNFSPEIMEGTLPLKIEDLEHVADINANGLKEALSLGQNKDGHLWIENVEVVIKGLFDPDIRSVSTGDVFRLEGSWYLITTNGFLKV